MGFGFVNFADTDAAAAAKDALHDKDLEGKKLFVDRAQKKGERENMLARRYEAARNERIQEYEGKNLYMKNLPVRALSFAPCVPCIRCQVSGAIYRVTCFLSGCVSSVQGRDRLHCLEYEGKNVHEDPARARHLPRPVLAIIGVTSLLMGLILGCVPSHC